MGIRDRVSTQSTWGIVKQLKKKEIIWIFYQISAIKKNISIIKQNINMSLKNPEINKLIDNYAKQKNFEEINKRVEQFFEINNLFICHPKDKKYDFYQSKKNQVILIRNERKSDNLSKQNQKKDSFFDNLNSNSILKRRQTQYMKNQIQTEKNITKCQKQ
eukprot:TRINITY_DN1283_c0_g1_i1.p1 TRINITY_DN1283_c0_g1~~TRINITY_DN1283_c0_g1_i1.p1  ORF type:complete len:175 (-),score=49.18 TRINITY_DN1283_c0_g1_i1:41-520(-)